MKAIVAGTLDSQSSVGNDQLKPFWTELFSRKTECTPLDVTRDDPPVFALAKPISKLEVKNLLRVLKKTSPGADKVDKVALKKIGVERLTPLYNLILITGYAPPELIYGKVTLLPKKAVVTEPGQFRPITVSSLILRSYHSILT